MQRTRILMLFDESELRLRPDDLNYIGINLRRLVAGVLSTPEHPMSADDIEFLPVRYNPDFVGPKVRFEIETPAYPDVMGQMTSAMMTLLKQSAFVEVLEKKGVHILVSEPLFQLKFVDAYIRDF